MPSRIKCVPKYLYLIAIIICLTGFLLYQSANGQKWTEIFLNVEQCETMQCIPKDLTKIGTLMYGFMGALTISFYFYHKTISPNLKRLNYECNNILIAASGSTSSAKTVICILEKQQVIIDYKILLKELDNIKNNIDVIVDIFANSRGLFTVEHRKAIYNILLLMGQFNNIKLFNLDDWKTINYKLDACVLTLNDDISIKGMKKIVEILK